MPPASLDRYIRKLDELCKSDRLVDWSVVATPIGGGRKRIAKWHSELT
jgi:hypothetical protein